MNHKSQNEKILQFLESGRAIDPLLALRKFGSLRLGARIHNLKTGGHRIVTTMVTKNGKRFATYRLEKQA